jgi:outer membrane immunogenic protein
VTNGPWLFYGKVGGGWVGNNSFTITNVTTGASITTSNNNTNSGWLVGAGIEWAFAPNWSAKIEYNYLGAGQPDIYCSGRSVPRRRHFHH